MTNPPPSAGIERVREDVRTDVREDVRKDVHKDARKDVRKVLARVCNGGRTFFKEGWADHVGECGSMFRAPVG